MGGVLRALLGQKDKYVYANTLSCGGAERFGGADLNEAEEEGLGEAELGPPGSRRSSEMSFVLYPQNSVVF